MLWKMWQDRKAGVAPSAMIEDPIPSKDQVSWKLYVPLTAIMVLVNCVVAARLFGMNVGLAILSVLLGFLWSFIAVQVRYPLSYD